MVEKNQRVRKDIWRASAVVQWHINSDVTGGAVIVDNWTPRWSARYSLLFAGYDI